MTDKIDEFDAITAKFCAALDKPYTETRRQAMRDAFGRMGPAGWQRIVTGALDEKRVGQAKLSVPWLWSVHRELRAKAPDKPAEPTGPVWQGDGWDELANDHLRRHISTQLRINPSRYGRTFRPPQHGAPIRTPELMHRAMELLVICKKTWALEMREIAIADRTPQYMSRFWHELMEEAERRITLMHEPPALTYQPTSGALAHEHA